MAVADSSSRKRKSRSWYEGLTSRDPTAKVLKVVSMEKDFRSTVPADLHPHEFLLRKLRDRHVNVEVRAFNEMDGFFEDPKPEEIEAYTSELIDAVRSSDIELLRKMHRDGKPLKCSNRFGESLLHLACRKQRIDVVDFLINEVAITPAVRDDFGRTILHEACWTPSPNFTLVDTILNNCPDLLYIKDKRGHTPLFYARQNHWESWIRHLEGRIEDLCPKHRSLLKD